jgi:hypothetical protein
VFHDVGSVVVEDEEVVGGLDEIDSLAGEGTANVEPGLADLDDAVPGDPGAADSDPAERSLFRSRFSGHR